jgi:transposase-like protein
MKGNKFYSESFKRAVIKEVLDGHISKADALRKYGIRGSSSIIYWIRKFEESDPQQSSMEYNKADKKDLIKRIKELERQLKDEQIRSFGYNKMIDIAEEQLNITIRKKPDTKQSKK